MSEALKTYPLHAWLAVGHLAEAEDELLATFPEIALEIRTQRVKYIAFHEGMADTPYHIPTLDLIHMICCTDAVDEQVDLPTPEDL